MHRLVLYDSGTLSSASLLMLGLNAPFGARCFMTRQILADVISEVVS